MKSRKSTIKRCWLFSVLSLVSISFCAGIAGAQDYPILDRVADKVIQKYQQSSCQQLWQEKSQPKPAMEERFVSLLQSDPQMRQAFLNKVAAPIANKMFECGMIP